MNLLLFRLFGPDRVNLGSFGRKDQALKAMRRYNANLKPGQSPAYVGAGPDHWRSKPENVKENIVPERGDDFYWVHAIFGAPPVLWSVSPDAWLGWYTERREEGFA